MCLKFVLILQLFYQQTSAYLFKLSQPCAQTHVLLTEENILNTNYTGDITFLRCHVPTFPITPQHISFKIMSTDLN